ncbi:sulfotransferase [Nitrosococcus oceani]|uniref:sulfotransferase n=1 Tax=Nitrosococcus oceani TaxID=1229 RepID=UPI0004E8F0E0|nr:sulfotransferase [Nitrosococcus oceani]KFI23873.1 hypothetical protein HW44_01705 [Nitrosococcus oceani]
MSNKALFKECGEKSPIFVISLERSGSTLLRNILDAHPEIFAPAQLNIGHLCHWTYWTSYYSIAQINTSLNEDKRKEAAIEETRNTVNGLMYGFTSKKNKSVWCDKSTMNIKRLEILTKIFPDARFICLYRNCLDFVYSYISISKLGFMEEVAPYVQKNPFNFVSAISDSWIDRTSAILDFESSGTAKCYRVNYESLVSDTVEILKDLFSFLELEWDDGLVNRVFSKDGKGPIEGDLKFQFSSKISTESVGQGVNIPLTCISKPQMEQINALLKRLGYPLIGTAAHPERSNALRSEGKPLSDEKDHVREIFRTYFPDLLKKRMKNFPSLNCTCKMLVSGEGGGVWTFDLTKPGGEVREEDIDTVCTIGLSSDVLKNMLAGNIKPLDAYQKGLVGAFGDIRMAINFGRLLFG